MIDNLNYTTFFKQFAVFLIVAIPLVSVSQIHENNFSESILEKVNQLEVAVSNSLNEKQPGLKVAQTNIALLDSVIEEVNKFNYIENNVTYYEYIGNQLNASNKYFYGNDATSFNYKESKTYFSGGKLKENKKTKIFKRDGMQDTSVIVYLEENTYSNSNLTKQCIFNATYTLTADGDLSVSGYDSLTYCNSFEYNSQNQLEISNKFVLWFPNSTEGRYDDFYYYYATDGSLQYEHSPFQLTRFDTEYIDDVCVKSKKVALTSMDNDVELFESITSWTESLYDYLTYDAMGRVKTLTNIYESEFSNGVNKKFKFKAEFEYNTNNQLTHASYYLYDNEEDSTSLFEFTRIDNLYDAEGNIIEYQKTFYDEQYGTWEMHTKKTYYYNSHMKNAKGEPGDSNNLRIYPNPVKNSVNLLTDEEFIGHYTLYNVAGKVVSNSNQMDYPINVNSLPKGIYFLKLENESLTKVIRFIKE